jgi:hypothetical protein
MLKRSNRNSAIHFEQGATTMSTDKTDPSKKDATISSADDLVKTTKSGDVELSEEELNRVTGGDAVAGTFEKKVDIKWTTTTTQGG